MEGDAFRAFVIKHYGEKVFEGAVEQGGLAPAPTRDQDQAAGLLLDQAFEQLGVFFREFALADAYVSEEHDVIRRKRFLGAGEGRKVIGTVASPKLGMQEQAMHFHAGIAKALRR